MMPGIGPVRSLRLSSVRWRREAAALRLAEADEELPEFCHAVGKPSPYLLDLGDSPHGNGPGLGVEDP
jgi:hypothetical protein